MIYLSSAGSTPLIFYRSGYNLSIMNVQIDEIQNDLRKYLRQVEAGDTLTLFNGDQPVAEIKPLTPPHKMGERRPFGLARGEFVVPDDFDDPLPEDILRSFEGE